MCKRETESRKGLCYLPWNISEESETRQESNPGSIPPGQTSHIFLSHFGLKGFPRGSDGKESAYNAGNPGLIPGSGRSPAEGVATYSSIFTWKSHGQRSLVGYIVHGAPWRNGWLASNLQPCGLT